MLRKSNRAARTPPSTTRNGAHISTRPGHGHPADDTTAVEAATIPATWRSACIDVGYGVAGALAGDTAVASLPDPSPADVIDAVGDHLRSGRGVLAIHPAWRDDLARTLDTACCSLDTDLLVVHASTLPPLAAAVLIAQMGALAANGVGLGHLASALPLVEKSILPIGWLRSVTRLAHPATSMRHHVRSLLPRSAFVAYAGADPRVERVRRAQPSLEVPDAPYTLVVSEHRRGDRVLLQRALDVLGVGCPVVEVEPLSGASRWWGTDRLVELAVDATDLPAIMAQVGAAATACPWCTHLVADDPCPVCGMRRLGSPTAGRSPT